MSDAQSIYKFVLGLNETGGTIQLAYPSIFKYVWTIPTYYLYFGMPLSQDISYHPTKAKISGLQPSSTLRLLNVHRLFEMRRTRPFQITHVYLDFQINYSHGWTIRHSHFSSLVIILMLNTFNHHISSKHNEIGFFPFYIVYSIL